MASYTLETDGFKSQDQSVDLEQLNIFEGATGSGKTTIGMGLQFLAIGHVPILGARPEDTADLMRGDHLAVTLRMPGDRWIQRSIKRTDKGFKTSQEVSWLRDKRPGDHKRAILELFGTEKVEIAEMLDVRQLLDLSPQSRAERLADLLGAIEEKPIETAHAVWRHVLMRLTDTNPDRVPRHYQDMVECVSDAQLPHVRSISPLLQDKIAKVGLPGTIPWANEKKRINAAKVLGKRKARKELEAKVSSIPEAHPEEIRRLEQRRDDIQETLGGLKSETEAWVLRQEKRKDAQDRMADALSARDDATEMAKRAGPAAALSDRLQKDVDALAAEVDGLVAPSPGDFSEVQKLRAEAMRLRAEAEAIELPELPDLVGPEASQRVAAKRLAEAKADPWESVRIHAQTIADHILTVGEAREAVEALQKLVKDHGSMFSVEDHQKAAQKADDALKSAQAKHLNVQDVRAAKVDQRAAMTRRAKRMEQKAEKLAEPIQAAHDEQVAAFGKVRKVKIAERDQLRERLTERKAEAAMVARALQDATGAVKTAEAELRGLQNGGTQPDPAELTETVDAARQVREALEVLRAAAGTRDALIQIIEELKAAEAEAKVWAAVEWGLQRKREEGVTKAGGDLVDRMARFLKEADRTDLPYIFAQQGRTEIGWTTAEGYRVPIQALSGGEWTIYASALAAAISSLRQAEICFLIVEAAEPDGPTTEQLLAGIESQQHITIAVVMRRSPSQPAIPEGWNHQYVGEAVRQ